MTLIVVRFILASILGAAVGSGLVHIQKDSIANGLVFHMIILIGFVVVFIVLQLGSFILFGTLFPYTAEFLKSMTLTNWIAIAFGYSIIIGGLASAAFHRYSTR